MVSEKVTIYHNPRCSKSRGALEILLAEGIEPEVIEYLQTPPSAAELGRIIEMLACTPRDLIRKGEKEYKELQLDDPTLTSQQLLTTMAKHPILIERPIVVKGKRAVVGRPPERVRELM
jgi:arsenate reductase (glutaredoxin)